MAKRMRKQVEHDYLHLYEHADTLYKRYQAEIAVLMNSIVILEAEKALEQNERIEKPTFLAFIFAPLSFTASFSGINVAGLQHTPIWSWILMTVLILIVTIGFVI